MARILAAQPIRGAHAWTVVIIGLSLIAGFAWWCKRYADKWKVVKARVRDVTHRFVRRVKKALGRS
jgi:hypothetical protein